MECAMSQDNDKRELLKLRQGIIDKSDAIDETGYDVNMPSTAGEKAKNWMWYHTGLIVLAVLLIGVGIVIYFAFFAGAKPDMTIYSAGNYTMTMRTMLENTMKNYCPDFDSDGETVIGIEQSVKDEMLGNTDLYEEVMNGHSQIFIGTKEQLTALYDDVKSATGEALFADLGTLTGTDGYAVDIRETSFGKNAQIFSTEIFIAVRRTDDESQRHAEEFVGNLISGKNYI